LFAKPSPLNINLSSDRFSMFNKERDIFGRLYPYSFKRRVGLLLLVVPASVGTFPLPLFKQVSVFI